MKAKLLLLLSSAGLVLLAAAPDAFAVTPGHFSGSGTGAGVVDCGTFVDNYTDVWSDEGTVFFDRAGALVKVVIHSVSHSTDTNSVTGLELHEHNRYTVTIDFVAQTVKYAGATLLMNRQGAGLVIHDSGIQIWNFDNEEIFEGGIHQAVHEGDAAFCRALA